MRRQVATLALLLTVGSLSACAQYTTTGQPQETAEAVAATAPAEVAGPTLAGTSWTLTDSSMKAAGLDQFAITAAFDDKAVSGHAPVNTYNASYQVTGDEIAFGPVASTMMAGEPAAMAAEGAYFALLSTVTSFRQDSDSLVLLADQVPVLTFKSGEAAEPTDQTAAAAEVADTLVGMTAAEAEQAVVKAGLVWRVISEDGKLNPATMDFRVDRINAALVKGKVESATVG